jgi:hypothetical protein
MPSFIWLLLSSVVIIPETVKTLLEKVNNLNFSSDVTIANPEKFPFQERLFRLIPKDNINIDLNKSSIDLEKCAICGKFHKSRIIGIEEKNVLFDNLGNFSIKTTPRLPGHGIYVDRKYLTDTDVFIIEALPFRILCTENFKDSVTKFDLSDIEFNEIGETF